MMEHIVAKAALIGVLGIGAQWLAWRFQWPAIVLMALAGIAAGPVLGLIDPVRDFGPFLQPVISLAVAIILFEGGLSLNLKELRHAGGGVGRLVFPGVPLAWGLGAWAAHVIAGLSWPVAILFAGILVVTGPTVIVPLLRQANLAARPRTLLKWEGIVNDPIGALLAVLVYDYLSRAGASPSLSAAALEVLLASAVAALLGLAAAGAVIFTFPRGYVPEFLKAPVLLVAVIGCFAAANAVEHETGLLAVTVMGVVLANARIASIDEIRRFKESISVLLISGVFVLLTASLSLDMLTGFEARYGLFLLALLFVVRPASVILATIGTDLSWRERLFVGWIAPRGIVAVAVSGLFALRLEALGYADAAALTLLSFAVVFATILAHGFSARWLAQKLDLASHATPGVLIVGASAWSVELAKSLKALEIPAAIADASWRRLRAARQAGIDVYYGEILSEVTEHRFDLNRYGYLLAVTGNEAYNALVCTDFAPELGRDRVFQLGSAETDDPHGLSHTLRGQTLFKSGSDLAVLQRRHFDGWNFQRTRLSEKFSFDDYLAQRPDESEILFVMRKNKALSFSTSAARPRVEAGDVVVAYAPPSADTKTEQKPTRQDKPQLPG